MKNSTKLALASALAVGVTAQLAINNSAKLKESAQKIIIKEKLLSNGLKTKVSNVNLAMSVYKKLNNKDNLSTRDITYEKVVNALKETDKELEKLNKEQQIYDKNSISETETSFNKEDNIGIAKESKPDKSTLLIIDYDKQ